MPQDLRTALLIIDVQNDFCPGGALPVSGGDEIVSLANQLSTAAQTTILTQDWHPTRHSSFASSHKNGTPFDTIELDYGPQTLWPDHCLQGSPGAAFHPDLETDRAQAIIRKGFRPHIDSYSAFFENDHETSTGLGGLLRNRGINRVVLCGLATDYCVAYSALDAVAEGFDVFVVEDACRAIDLGDSLTGALAQFAERGVKLTNVTEALGLVI